MHHRHHDGDGECACSVNVCHSVQLTIDRPGTLQPPETGLRVKRWLEGSHGYGKCSVFR